MSLPASLIDTPMYEGGKLSFPWIQKFGEIGQTAPVQALLSGTSVERIATDRSTLPDGTLWYETDTGDFYRLQYQDQAAVWMPLHLATLDDLAEMVSYGAHGTRPDPAGILDGAIYVETDRSGVIYQNQGGTWHFLAGTMWDTFSPDQRPTDLGANDAGFTYRTTDLPARSFVWSGTAWVETTAASNSVQLAVGAGNVTLTTSNQNVPGASLTITRPGTYLVKGIAWLNVNGTGDAATPLGCQILASGAAISTYGLFQNITAGAGSSSATVPCECLYTHSGGSVILTLSVVKFGGTGASFCGGAQSTISALWVNS